MRPALPLLALPTVFPFLSLSLSLACSCGSSVDRVSSMRTERPGVGRQLLWRPTKASTTTTTTSTTTVAAAPAAPAHHHHPGHRSARQFLVFSSEGLPFSKCAAALRVRAIFLCERRGETGPAVKKRISGRCCVRLEICRAWSRKLLSKSRRDFLSRYIHLIAIRNNAINSHQSQLNEKLSFIEDIRNFTNFIFSISSMLSFYRRYYMKDIE